MFRRVTFATHPKPKNLAAFARRAGHTVLGPDKLRHPSVPRAGRLPGRRSLNFVRVTSHLDAAASRRADAVIFRAAQPFFDGRAHFDGALRPAIRLIARGRGRLLRDDVRVWVGRVMRTRSPCKRRRSPRRGGPGRGSCRRGNPQVLNRGPARAPARKWAGGGARRQCLRASKFPQQDPRRKRGRRGARPMTSGEAPNSVETGRRANRGSSRRQRAGAAGSLRCRRGVEMRGSRDLGIHRSQSGYPRAGSRRLAGAPPRSLMKVKGSIDHIPKPPARVCTRMRLWCAFHRSASARTRSQPEAFEVISSRAAELP